MATVAGITLLPNSPIMNPKANGNFSTNWNKKVESVKHRLHFLRKLHLESLTVYTLHKTFLELQDQEGWDMRAM
jgi:hypothetical protein